MTYSSQRLILFLSILAFCFQSCRKDDLSVVNEEHHISISNFRAWNLCSTPLEFPEATRTNDLSYGYNRALIAWNNIDPLFLRNNSSTPSHILNDPDLQSSHLVREVSLREIDPDFESPNGMWVGIATLNLSYYPLERGPYNYETDESDVSAGIDYNGKLIDPTSRWGGIIRRIESCNLPDLSLDFWIMDPFFDGQVYNGSLVFDVGDISEDVLKDNRLSSEANLPYDNDPSVLDTTAWGYVSSLESTVFAFSFSGRENQDIGLDGLSSYNGSEQEFHLDFITKCDSMRAVGILSDDFYFNIFNDPSNDDYHYYRGSDYDALELGILDRYKYFNNMEGNSEAFDMNSEGYPTAATTTPNFEDINIDGFLETTNNYMSFELPLTKENFNTSDYLREKITVEVEFNNGVKDSITWYNIRIPKSYFHSHHGSLESINNRYIRIYLTGFQKEIHLRFAKMEFAYNF